jgi:3-oxoacyl-[acyl-carrier-protein] synthase II
MGEPQERACVTGIGVITPIGSDVDSFWVSLGTGRQGARTVRSFDTSGLSHRVGCEVPDLTIPDFAAGSILGGRGSELAVASAVQAMESAGLRAFPCEARQGAVVVASTMGDITRFERTRAAHVEREADDSDLAALADQSMDVMARSIASLYGITGPVISLCETGTAAIGVAASLVQSGRARAALAVGCETFSRFAFTGLARMHALSPDLCRPFSRGRAGLLLGEGAGALLIESVSAAQARGALMLGFVDGAGYASDAHHGSGPHAEGEGAARAMTEALARAGVSPRQVDYVNAHGTGTPRGDRMECFAIHKVFSERGRSVPVSSIKALTGHMMGASGAVEAVASLLAMRDGLIPPTWNWVEPDPDCDIDCVPNAVREAPLRRVLSCSSSFGGSHASVLLSAPRPGRAPGDVSAR